MKKLMLTTAIASVFTTAVVAQTTISGQLRVNYKDGSNISKGINPSTTAGTTDSVFGFGTEQQINIQTKGKLNVGGLDYAAGMSFEWDGDQTAAVNNENVYFDFTNASSGTTISFSRDHIQRSDTDFSATNLVAFTPNEMSQLTTSAGTIFAQNIGAAPGQNMGAAIIQKTPIGSFSYNYVPNNAAPAASEDVNANTTAAYEYGFLGDLGVKGLQVHYFKNANQDFTTTTNTAEAEGKNYGIQYNFGQVTVGANKKVYNPEATIAAKLERNEKAFAVAYAVDKNLTVGALYAKADLSGAGLITSGATANNNTQKVKGINIGYALGPVDLAVGYAKNTDLNGISGADADVFMARLIGNF
jgi:hypothetical protein